MTASAKAEQPTEPRYVLLTVGGDGVQHSPDVYRLEPQDARKLATELIQSADEISPIKKVQKKFSRPIRSR